ncbi:MAG: hypothetical protein J7K82_05665 [Thermoproteales archaeon]|nr:hypothetical protein [Thermoproteales archaeon]
MKRNVKKLNKSTKEQKVVILDTDFLMHSIDNKLNFIEEIRNLIEGPIRICVVKSTLKELQKISRNKSWKYSRTARLVLDLLKAEKIEVLDDDFINEKSTDKKIAILAKKMSGIVATDDKEFRRKLLKEDIGVIFIRQKKKLILVR